jgi:hypothetical protein
VTTPGQKPSETMRAVTVMCGGGVALDTSDITTILHSLSKRYDEAIVDLIVKVYREDEDKCRIEAEGIYDPAYSLSTHAIVLEGGITADALKWQ